MNLMDKPATRADVVNLGQTFNTAIVALIATLLQQREPHRTYSECVFAAISRVRSVDDPSVPV